MAKNVYRFRKIEKVWHFATLCLAGGFEGSGGPDLGDTWGRTRYGFPAKALPEWRSRMRNEFTAILERDGDWYVAYCPEILAPMARGEPRTTAQPAYCSLTGGYRTDIGRQA